MTRKDYKVIATALAKAFKRLQMPYHEQKVVMVAVEEAFEEDNSGFNADRFELYVDKATNSN
jgi:hypothetical protein